jgi:hypothetical protein
MTPTYHRSKRSLDLVFAAAGIVVTAPVCIRPVDRTSYDGAILIPPVSEAAVEGHAAYVCGVLAAHDLTCDDGQASGYEQVSVGMYQDVVSTPKGMLPAGLVGVTVH